MGNQSREYIIVLKKDFFGDQAWIHNHDYETKLYAKPLASTMSTRQKS